MEDKTALHADLVAAEQAEHRAALIEMMLRDSAQNARTRAEQAARLGSEMVAAGGVISLLGVVLALAVS
jgi:hypothetical protein